MTRFKRIRYYMLGLGLGLVLVFFLFNGKNFFSFMPNNRVLDDIKRSTILITPKQKALIECAGVKPEDIYEFMENGDVDFYNSIKEAKRVDFTYQGKPFQIPMKKYIIECNGHTLWFWTGENANRKKFSLIFAKDQNCGDVAELADDYLEIWQIPDSWVFNQIKARKLYLSPEIECELACHNITQQDLDKMLTDGKVLIDESFPYRTPNPLYFIQLDKNGVKWVFWVEIGQAKVRIKHILDITGIKLKKNEFLINKLFTQVKEADDCGCY